MPETIKVNFWCNAGYTEEIVEVKLYEDNGTIEEQIQEAFEKWLDNNEDVGWDIVTDENDITCPFCESEEKTELNTYCKWLCSNCDNAYGEN